MSILSFRKNPIRWPSSNPTRTYAYSAIHRNRRRAPLPPPPPPSSHLSNLPPTLITQKQFRSYIIPLYSYGWYITSFLHRMIQNDDGVWIWKPYKAPQLGNTFRLQGFRNAGAFLERVFKLSLQERRIPSLKLTGSTVRIHFHTAKASLPQNASDEMLSNDTSNAGITGDDIRFATLVQDIFEEYISDKRAIVSLAIKVAQPAFQAIDVSRWHLHLKTSEVERFENTLMPLPAIKSVDRRPPPLPFGLAPPGSGKVEEETHGTLRAITDEDVQTYLKPLYTHGWGVAPLGREMDNYPQLVRLYNLDTSNSMNFVNWICGFVQEQSRTGLTIKFRHEQLSISPCSPSIHNISNRDIQLALRIAQDDLHFTSRERSHPPKWAPSHPANLHELEQITPVQCPDPRKDARRVQSIPILGKLPPMAKAK